MKTRIAALFLCLGLCLGACSPAPEAPPPEDPAVFVPEILMEQGNAQAQNAPAISVPEDIIAPPPLMCESGDCDLEDIGEVPNGKYAGFGYEGAEYDAAYCIPCGDVPLGAYIALAPKDARAFLLEYQEAVLVDLREKKAYDRGHIEGAVLLPGQKIGTKEMDRVLPDKEADILVYAGSAKESEAGARALIEEGYLFVYDIGDLNVWPYGLV